MVQESAQRVTRRYLARVAQKQVVARPVQPVDRSKTYYHGTSKTQDAAKIMREGLVPPDLNGRKDFLTPVQGKVYPISITIQ
jgi:hypothetical protein